MSLDREKLCQAYLDGELTVGECTEFEATLSPEECERLAGENQFEAGLAEVMSRDADCPDDMWQRIQAQVKVAQAPRNVVPFRRKHWLASSVAAAAVVAYFLIFSVPTILRLPGDPTDSATLVSAGTVDELAALSETAPSMEAIQKFLEENGINLVLVGANELGMTAIHGKIDVLGAREETVNGKKVVSLLFGCCQMPVKVVIAKRGSEAGKLLGQTVGDVACEVQSTRAVGDGRFVAAVVGQHSAGGLLDLFDGPPGADPTDQ
jgi:hypothetical protein